MNSLFQVLQEEEKKYSALFAREFEKVKVQRGEEILQDPDLSRWKGKVLDWRRKPEIFLVGIDG